MTLPSEDTPTGTPFPTSMNAAVSSFFSSFSKLSPTDSGVSGSTASTTGSVDNTSQTNVPATVATTATRTSADQSTAGSSKTTSAVTQSAPTSSVTSAPASASSSGSANPSSATPTTFATETSTAASAASTSGIVGATPSLEKNCSGLSCSPALKAAVAIPVVLVGLGILFALFFARRRRRNAGREPSGKKWTRHLRMFSFDAELLVGGRGSRSLLSRSVGSSLRSATNPTSLRSQPSIRSLDNPAPPYRDAISQAQPPNMAQLASIGALGTFGGHIPTDLNRPASSATAPPPYGAAVGATDRLTSPTTPTSPTNPFRDSAPVSPVDGSPFADPPGERPVLSRGSSRYESVRGDDVSTLADPDDIGSVREAQVARNVSGRIRNT